jgi:hypothetical protein
MANFKIKFHEVADKDGNQLTVPRTPDQIVSSGVKELNAQTGTWYAKGVNPQGKCSKCSRRVYHHAGLGEVDVGEDEFMCPITGCGGFIDVDQVAFFDCEYYTEHQKRVKGGCDPPGKRNFHTTKVKSVDGKTMHEFIDEGSEDKLANYVILRFFAT